MLTNEEVENRIKALELQIDNNNEQLSILISKVDNMFACLYHFNEAMDCIAEYVGITEEEDYE